MDTIMAWPIHQGEAAVRATEAVTALRDEPSAAVLAESVLFRLEALRAARAGSGGVPWIAVLTDFQLPTFSGGVRTDCVVGIERDSLSGIKSLASEVPHGRDDRPLVGARARRMRVRGPAFGPALAQTHRAYGGRDRG